MLNKNKFTELIKKFELRELFNELGWDNVNVNQSVSVYDEVFHLTAVAEKRGFMIFVCSPDKEGKIPEYNTRKKIDNKITKLFFEHLIIYSNKNNFQQVWQLVIKEPNKPVVVRETPFFKTQQPDLLFQKLRGLFFTIDDEDRISIVDVKSNILEQFNTNAEKVTKKFYTEFKAQHISFLKFIKGIEAAVDKDWYASLMLNRLMFIYFIQKKGFLDSNINYLRAKLKETQKKKGKDKFYSFYRDFLLVLFHQGLGSPERPKSILEEIGRVPYLNGGLFDVHELETTYKEIKIDDKAFEKIFEFFDEYNWHLDTRIDASGQHINPDVIGYIFEKYINDRASMGAYYTKEDITEYISKNTIIPYLFDQVKKECANAFRDESSLWKMHKENPDNYIYPAIRKGNEHDLPEEIDIGLDASKPELLERRKNWNKTASEEYALPTEIWREVVERRTRYSEIKKKIENDEIRDINDFITYNLDIRQFAQDAVQQYEGSDFINAFYKAIGKITILDPTCGSGAFLFAALNILEPLYEACIQRMRGFIEEDNRHLGKKFPQFRKVISEIELHPGEKYYIFKSIILNNLYGVDLMKEAVEIAKLRLFLKLVAEIEPDYSKKNMGLEPLPDIDFNIRAGNTLVGFATKEELEKGLQWSFNYDIDKEKIYEQMDMVSLVFKRFKEVQLSDETVDFKKFKKAKEELNLRLKELNVTLNDYLGNDYGKSRKDAKVFAKWLNDYKPFHWFAEFYEIMNDEGFNVIIGNPPYLNLNKINYLLRSEIYTCLECKDLFALTIERAINLLKKDSRNGFIVPLSAFSTDTMIKIRERVFKDTSHTWDSYYSASDQPASLFNGVRHRLLIMLNKIEKNGNGNKYSTNFLKWFSEERMNLFKVKPVYSFLNDKVPQNSKISRRLENVILNKIFKDKGLNNFIRDKGQVLYFHNAPVHWGKVFDFVPYFSINSIKQKSSHVKAIYFTTKEERDAVICLLNSSLFYWFNWQYSNCRDLSLKDIYKMHFSLNNINPLLLKKFGMHKQELMKDFRKNSKVYKRATEDSESEFDSFYPMYSKNIINEIDKDLGTHYGFTEEELDFIINYDIKYRMGKELEEED